MELTTEIQPSHNKKPPGNYGGFLLDKKNSA
jgi:hypothetical protein